MPDSTSSEPHSTQTCKTCGPIMKSAPYKRGVAAAKRNQQLADAQS